jgi:antitoxin MazE
MTVPLSRAGLSTRIYDCEKDIRAVGTKVARWGNSLAVRLPRKVVDELGLREGDEVQLAAAGASTLAVSRDRSREEALERIKALRWPLPPGYKFDRDEANARGGFTAEPDMIDPDLVDGR